MACWRTRTPLLVRGDSHLQTPRSPLKRVAKELGYRAFIPRFDGYLVVGERSRSTTSTTAPTPTASSSCPTSSTTNSSVSGPRGRRGPLRAKLGTPTTRSSSCSRGSSSPRSGRPTRPSGRPAPPAGPRCPDPVRGGRWARRGDPRRGRADGRPGPLRGLQEPDGTARLLCLRRPPGAPVGE